jgi:formylglycine-generating enzyme required for sulfatase activity
MFWEWSMDEQMLATEDEQILITEEGEPIAHESTEQPIQIIRKPRRTQCFTETRGISLDLMLIPGGTFLMGSPEDELGRWDDEGPQHEVTVPPFLMGRYPITQAQWREIAQREDLQVKKSLQLNPSHFEGDDHPVEQVSWEDAVEFCDRLSRVTERTYRLPTEAEWEYACRAGTTTPFHFGNSITTDLANYRGTDRDDDPEEYPGHYGKGPKGVYRQTTTPVQQFHPLANAFGLCEMHGNVWEWCLDHWHSNYEDKPEALKQDGSIAWLFSDKSRSRVLRGGSWNDNPRHCRSAYRNDFTIDSNDNGFRVVCEVRGL